MTATTWVDAENTFSSATHSARSAACSPTAARTASASRAVRTDCGWMSPTRPPEPQYIQRRGRGSDRLGPCRPPARPGPRPAAARRTAGSRPRRRTHSVLASDSPCQSQRIRGQDEEVGLDDVSGRAAGPERGRRPGDVDGQGVEVHPVQAPNRFRRRQPPLDQGPAGGQEKRTAPARRVEDGGGSGRQAERDQPIGEGRGRVVRSPRLAINRREQGLVSEAQQIGARAVRHRRKAIDALSVEQLDLGPAQPLPEEERAGEPGQEGPGGHRPLAGPRPQGGEPGPGRAIRQTRAPGRDPTPAGPRGGDRWRRPRRWAGPAHRSGSGAASPRAPGSTAQG